MKKIDINDPQVLELTAKVLASGGVVMHPTETCYGLAVDIFNEQALQKLYRVKKMQLDKPVSILVDSVEMAERYAVFSDLAHELAAKYWPGPLSIVLPSRQSLPDFLNPGQKFASIRYSGLDFCSKMVKAFGGPVTTTSANISGEPQMYSPLFLDGVDLLVDGGVLIEKAPSTIVKVVDGNIEVLRKGDLKI